jgi:hypothetical protein
MQAMSHRKRLAAALAAAAFAAALSACVTVDTSRPGGRASGVYVGGDVR